MKHLIKEIESSIANQNYLSALSLTLTLPDICGKISHPDDGVGERYKNWYNKYIFPYELSPLEDDQNNKWVPDGHIIYKLRCNLLHDGSLDVEKDVKQAKGMRDSDDYKFILTNNITSINLVWEDGDKSKVPSVLVRIGIEDFCLKICTVAENFYNESYSNKDIYNDIVIFDFD